MTTVVGGLVGTSTAVPLEGDQGDSTVSQSGGTITNSGNNYSLPGQVLPDPITITGISASFVNTVGEAIPALSTISLTAQVWVSSDGGTTYIALPGALVNLEPSYTGVIALGEVSSGSTFGLSIPVPAGNLAMVVFSITTTQGVEEIVTSLSGTGTAGISYTG